jgi:hypothetical protein
MLYTGIRNSSNKKEEYVLYTGIRHSATKSEVICVIYRY